MADRTTNPIEADTAGPDVLDAFRTTNSSTPTLTPRECEERQEKKSGEATKETPVQKAEDEPIGKQVKLTTETPIASADSSPTPSRLDVTKQPAMSEKADVDGSKPPGECPPEVDEAEDNFKPKTMKFWLVILSNFVSLFLVALDRTIIATAIPRITDEFGSLGDIGWYGSAYMLTTAASQLVFGRVYKFYNLRMYAAPLRGSSGRTLIA